MPTSGDKAAADVPGSEKVIRVDRERDSRSSESFGRTRQAGTIYSVAQGRPLRLSPLNRIEDGAPNRPIAVVPRATVAVDDLTLEVPAGGVYGFLGPNGWARHEDPLLLGWSVPRGIVHDAGSRRSVEGDVDLQSGRSLGRRRSSAAFRDDELRSSRTQAAFAECGGAARERVGLAERATPSSRLFARHEAAPRLPRSVEDPELWCSDETATARPSG